MFDLFSQSIFLKKKISFVGYRNKIKILEFYDDILYNKKNFYFMSDFCFYLASSKTYKLGYTKGQKFKL